MLKKVIAGIAVLALTQGIAFAQVPELPAACSSLMPLGKNLIYKGCSGSGHLSTDPRGRGTALIAKKNVSLRPLTCIKVYSAPTEEDPEGSLISGLYLYPFNDPRAYAWRGYSNYQRRCGRGDTRKTIRSRADGNPIFLKVTNRKCIKITKAFTNINSSQRTCDR